jgi:putative ABC transport system ATP-binding protein
MPTTPGSEDRLACDDLVVSFADAKGQRFRVVEIESISFAPGRLHVVSGPSGSGKSTLLYAIAGLAELESGRVSFGNDVLSDLSEAERDAWRRQHVGMVFQSFHLIPELNAEDNVLLPAWFGSFRADSAQRERAQSLLETLGVPEGRGAVACLSRGEQQRVALARALLFDPPIILADEPTASLDVEAGATVTAMLKRMATEDNRTIIAVSHDPAVIENADRLITLERGRVRDAAAREVAA